MGVMEHAEEKIKIAVDTLTLQFGRQSRFSSRPPMGQLIATMLSQRTGLADMPVEDAMLWLMNLPGVGYKTATFLLLFSFRKPVLPVDTHVHRVSQRLGIIDKKTNQVKAHNVLLNILPKNAEDSLNFHKLFFKHGQRICTWSQPHCKICVLTDICDYYKNQKETLFPTIKSNK